MNDEKLNNEFDNVFRELENLPEEKPSAGDWEQMSKRIQSEGLLSNSNGRKYFFLILLLALLSALVSLPFIMKNKSKNLKTETMKPAVKTQSQDSKNQPKISETKPNITDAQTGINPEAGSDNGNQSSSAHHLTSERTVQNVIAVNTNHGRVKQNSSDGGEAKEKTGDENMTENNDATASGEKQKADENADGKKSSTSPATSSDAADAQSKNNSGNGQSTTGGGQSSAQTGAADGKNLSSASALGDSTNATAQQAPVDSASTNPKDSTSAHDASTFRRFRLGIYVSLDYNYYALKDNNDVTRAESEYVRQSESISGDKWGGQYTVGIIGGYMFTKKLSLETGVFYSQKKKLHADIYTPAYSQDSGNVLFSNFSYDYQARYFEVYGRIKYYFHQAKNSFYATIGATGSYNLPSGNAGSDYFSRTSYGESSSETERVTLDASSASAVMVISAGMEIPVSERWVVYIEPAYRYSFNPVVKHPSYDRIPVEHFMRCLSLATGLMYKF